ncbi:MAG: hypothetical protein DWI58_19165 [Chloroflexi bacterium]|nr:MAG: hypothetical protein DWI58_19165 [Chloroflexota bacterium]
MRLRKHHLFVITGLVCGVIAATYVETEPRYIGWLFAVGGGLGGGAFLAAITSGDALAGSGSASGASDRGRRTRRGNPVRPAWFDEPDSPTPDTSDDEPPTRPRNGTL